MSLGSPWVCPECHRVYGPMALECDWCNRKIVEREKEPDEQEFREQYIKQMQRKMGQEV